MIGKHCNLQPSCNWNDQRGPVGCGCSCETCAEARAAQDAARYRGGKAKSLEGRHGGACAGQAARHEGDMSESTLDAFLNLSPDVQTVLVRTHSEYQSMQRNLREVQERCMELLLRNRVLEGFVDKVRDARRLTATRPYVTYETDPVDSALLGVE